MKEKFKVLQINAVSNYGSTGIIVENIADVSLSQGWQPYIACGERYSRPSKYNRYVISNKFQNYCAAVYTLLTDRHGFYLNNSTKKFIKWIDSINPDVIHLHNIHSYYLNIEILFQYLSQTNKPVIWTLHDCWAFTGHCSHFIRKNCEKWKTECYACPLTHAFPKSLFFDRSRNNFRDKNRIFNSIPNLYITTVSHWLKDCVKQSFLKQHPIEVIYNGINTKIFRTVSAEKLRVKYNLHNKFVLIGVSTCWCTAKGLNDYIKLREQLSDDFAIVLIGMTSSQINNITNTGIIAVGRTSNVEELIEWYSLADVVMNLSYAETFGLPIVEGFSCGTPGIVYNDTALPELILGKTGYIVPPGDIQAVVEALYSLKSIGKSHYGEVCRKRAVSIYDKNTNYLKYIDLYNKVLSK